MDFRIQAALVTAAAVVITAVTSQAIKIFSDLHDRRRRHRISLMNLRNELVVNLSLARAMTVCSRTFGMRFIDSVWTTGDTSVIYLGRQPAERILAAYTKMQLFNCLNERYQLIARSPEYGPSRGQRLVDEQKEQADLAAEIERLLAELVPAIRI